MRRSAPKRIADYFESEARSGVLLIVAALLALLWANSGWSGAYFALWEETFLGFSVRVWINDVLMSVFFLLVGLEIKRELAIGELSHRAKAMLPMVAALGGMVVPAAVFALFNSGTEHARGWGIPMATDIAFALGVLALAGPRIPQSLRVFLAALAIIDDLGAVAVIAIFYSSNLVAWAFGGMALCVLVLAFLNRLRVRRAWVFVVVGIPLWWFTHESGVHATISGVILAMFLPTTRDASAFSPLESLENAIGPHVRVLVMPLFALANAGVALAGVGGLGSPLSLGILLGLVVGKPLGIVGACWIGVKLGVARLPEGVGRRLLLGAGLLAGIGFTMSLFITQLAFVDLGAIQISKLAILSASVLSGVLGLVWLRATAKRSSFSGVP